jgi:hypothetical protein
VPKDPSSENISDDRNGLPFAVFALVFASIDAALLGQLN